MSNIKHCTFKLDTCFLISYQLQYPNITLCWHRRRWIWCHWWRWWGVDGLFCESCSQFLNWCNRWHWQCGYRCWFWCHGWKWWNTCTIAGDFDFCTVPKLGTHNEETMSIIHNWSILRWWSETMNAVLTCSGAWIAIFFNPLTIKWKWSTSCHIKWIWTRPIRSYRPIVLVISHWYTAIRRDIMPPPLKQDQIAS